MADRLYRLARIVGTPFRYHVRGLDRVAASGPALFVGNHAGSAGPLATIISLPMRLYPWVAAATLDPARAPQRIYDEVVAREMHLRGRPGMALARLFADLGGRVPRAVECVPVEPANGLFDASLRQSQEMLASGRHAC